MAFVFGAAFADEVVYRSVAEDGTVIYSDRPIEGATPVTLDVPNAALRAAAGGNTARRDPGGERGGARDEPEPREPADDELAEQRERNCEIATERVERYNAANRLYRTLENGEREYLDDDEIDEARAQAEADVETWCG